MRGMIPTTLDEAFERVKEHGSEAGGWLVSTNLNKVLKRTIIKFAAEVAELTFGKDVILEF
jgi:hypothetical protein